MSVDPNVLTDGRRRYPFILTSALRYLFFFDLLVLKTSFL